MPEPKKPGGAPRRPNRAPRPPEGGPNRRKQGSSPRRIAADRKPAPAAPPRAEPVQEKPLPDLTPPEFVMIAQISSPFGLRGAVKATIHTDFPERFEELQEVYLLPPDAPAEAERQKRPLLSARMQNEKQVVLRFEGITKVEQAETLRGYTVSIPVAEVMPLPEGEYYIFQIVGLEVYSTDEQFVGKVVNVERLPANDIYVVRGPLAKNDVLIPAIKDVVKQIDLDNGRITIELMEGLLP